MSEAKFLQFDEVNSESLVNLFEKIHGAKSLVERDLWFVLERKVIVRLFSKQFYVLKKA